MTALLDGTPLEHIEAVEDPVSGLKAFIAIHSTARGPAFGGCRLWTYRNEDEAAADAIRLAEGMSYKNALAELPFGGGKAVIMMPPKLSDRKPLFRAFGHAVERLGGRFITAEDVGTTPADMLAIRSVTPYVSGLPRTRSFGGDPSRFTALGVFLAIQTAVRAILKRDSLDGATVAVQGVGAVGAQLCFLLARAGAKLWVFDLDPMRAALAASQWGARIVSAETLLRMDVDVLAPAAVGGTLDARTVERLNAKIVAGAANNQLATIEDGDRLHARGIWYLPDFLVNAGGIISVAREYLGTSDETRVTSEVALIAERVERLIYFAKQYKTPPARLALSWAKAAMAP